MCQNKRYLPRNRLVFNTKRTDVYTFHLLYQVHPMVLIVNVYVQKNHLSIYREYIFFHQQIAKVHHQMLFPNIRVLLAETYNNLKTSTDSYNLTGLNEINESTR